MRWSLLRNPTSSPRGANTRQGPRRRRRSPTPRRQADASPDDHQEPTPVVRPAIRRHATCGRPRTLPCALQPAVPRGSARASAHFPEQPPADVNRRALIAALRMGRCATRLPAPACARHDAPALRSQSSPPPRWDDPADRVRAEPPTARSRTRLTVAHVQVSESRDRRRLRPIPDRHRARPRPSWGTGTTIPADGPGPPSRPKKNPAEAGSFACST